MASNFAGPAYSSVIDGIRLQKQHERIRDLMLDGKWRTLSEIAKATGDHEASISAQLRHLRKPRFGSYRVDKRRRLRASGLYEYHLEPTIVTELQIFSDSDRNFLIDLALDEAEAKRKP